MAASAPRGPEIAHVAGRRWRSPVPGDNVTKMTPPVARPTASLLKLLGRVRPQPANLAPVTNPVMVAPAADLLAMVMAPTAISVVAPAAISVVAPATILVIAPIGIGSAALIGIRGVVIAPVGAWRAVLIDLIAMIRARLRRSGYDQTGGEDRRGKAGDQRL